MAENRSVKVTLRAEIAQYVSSMLRGAKATTDLGSAATSAASDIDQAMNHAEKSAKSSEQTFTRWGTVTKSAFAAVVLAAGAYTGALIAQGISANSFAEQNQSALTVMLGDANAAKSAMDDVYALATETPFQFPVLTSQFKTLAASGMELEKIIPTMRAYSNAAAVLGDESTLSTFAEVISRTETLGKASMEQLNRLADVGVPVYDMLANAAGASTAEVQKQITAGLWDADRTIATITDGMNARYGGMLEEMGDNWNRLADKTKGAQRRTAEQLAKPVMEVGKEFFRQLTSAFNSTTAALKGVDWSPIVAPLTNVAAIIGDLGAGLSASSIQGVVSAIGLALELLSTTMLAVHAAAQPIVLLMAQAVAAGAPLLGALGQIVQVFGALPAPVQAAVVALVAFNHLRGPIMGFLDVAIPAARAFGTTWATAARSTVAETAKVHASMTAMAAGAGSAAPRTVAALQMVSGAAVTMGAGAKAAGASLLAAFGGPVGLIVAGTMLIVTTALGAWGAATAEQDAKLQSLTATLDANTGAITDATRASIRDSLETGGALQDLEALGIAYDDIVASIVDGNDQLDDTRRRLQAIIDADTSRGTVDSDESRRAQAALRALAAINGEAERLEAGMDSAARKARAAGDAIEEIDPDLEGEYRLRVDGALAQLAALRSQAQSAFASFIKLSPQAKKASSGGGGGGSGESPAVKAAKAEQKALKARTDAEKKATSDYEKLMQDRSGAAKDAADEAEKAAKDAADAEASSLEKSTRAVDAYVSAQRQRQAIERTLAAENDPVRRAQLQQALADATAHEASMLTAKAAAEREAATATAENTTAQALATETVAAASTAQAEYEAASARAAAVQEASAVQIEAASERLATATEDAASRAGGAMSGAADEVKEGLDEWFARMQQAWADQAEWSDNMLWLASNFNGAIVDAFLQGGADLAPILAEMRAGGVDAAQGIADGFEAAANDSKVAMMSEWAILSQLIPQISLEFGAEAAENLKREVWNGSLSVQEIMENLDLAYANNSWSLTIDADTEAAVAAAGGLVSYIESLRPTITPRVSMSGLYEPGKPVRPGSAFYYAEGGAIRGPGQKGKDSVPIIAAPGEHMLTTSDVDAMGGQAGVYAFRRGLHDSTPSDVSRAISSTAPRSEPRIVIHENVYYPVREPASKATNRTLQRLAAGFDEYDSGW